MCFIYFLLEKYLWMDWISSHYCPRAFGVSLHTRELISETWIQWGRHNNLYPHLHKFAAENQAIRSQRVQILRKTHLFSLTFERFLHSDWKPRRFEWGTIIVFFLPSIHTFILYIYHIILHLDSHFIHVFYETRLIWGHNHLQMNYFLIKIFNYSKRHSIFT